jgi:hypothetical protein
VKISLHLKVNNEINDDSDNITTTTTRVSKNVCSTLPYYRFKLELVLESADILYWDGSIRTNTAVDFSRPDSVFINRENKTALVLDLAVYLTHNLSNTKAEKIMRYENLALEIKNIRKLNRVFIYPLVMLAEGLPKISGE